MISEVTQMIRDAEKHADDMSHDRIRAIEYYQGEMRDTPHEEGRSSMVSKDLRANIKKVLPSIMRNIFGSDQVVEFLPVGPGDEAAAEQATDYVNKVIIPEQEVMRKAEDSIHDALQQRNGIIRWYWEDKPCVKVSKHTGLDENAFAMLAGSDDVEVLEHSPIEGQGPEGPVTLHDVKIRRTVRERDIKVACVPRERFLIHADAVTIQDSLLTGVKETMTRGELVQMGYDRDLVMGLQLADDEDDYEQDIRRDYAEDEGSEVHSPNEQVDYYDVYVRYDEDGDGVAELRHMVFAGALHERNMLINEECDEIQFCDIKAMTQPHQWEGISLADDLMDIQRVKTVLLRSTLDNLYWQNNPMLAVQAGVIDDMETVLNPEFGEAILVDRGTSVRDAIQPIQMPFTAGESYAMLNYMDEEAESRTGVSDASAGLSPDSLQNMTATGAQMLNQASIGQTEMMVRTIASGLRVFFQGLLRCIVKHQDVPRTVRLRDEWVEFDPRHWNAEMDCNVNVGLGAGTRERDMMMMQIVMGLQEKLLASFGPDNPFVKPENLWNALSRSVEAAGLKTPEMFFTEPDPQEIAQKMGQQGGESQAEMQKMQAEMQMKQQEMQVKAQMEQAKLQSEIRLKREQMTAEMALKREQMAAEMQLKREQMQMQVSMGAANITPIRMGGELG